MISRTRLGVVMAMACWCFGCKGAGGLGAALFGLAAAARVAPVVGTAVASHWGSDEARGDYYAGEPLPGHVAPAPRSCVELEPAPELPGDAYAVRTMACGGHVMVQDAHSGLWRDHR